MSAATIVRNPVTNTNNGHKEVSNEILHIPLMEQLENVMSSLQSLQHQCSSLDSERPHVKQNLLEQLQSGFSEAEMMRLVYTCMQHMHAKKHNLALNVQRLSQENAWLREELTRTQLQLRQCQERISTLEVEKEQLNFMQQLHERYDQQLNTPILTEETSQAEEMQQDKQQDPLLANKQQQSLSTILPSSISQEFFVNKTPISASSSKAGANQSSSNIAVSGYEIPSRLRVLHNLVVKYASEERYEVAVPLCNQALDDLKRDCGLNSPDVATMQNILAMLYRDQGKLNEAITLLNEALKIRENSLGPEDPAVAATLNNLAVLYGKLGRFKEAEPLCRRSLKIREKVLGENHIDVAKQLNNLALLCQNLGRYEEVESYYQRALSIYRNELGVHDANVAKTMNNLASSYLKQGKLCEAEALFRTVVHSLCTHHGTTAANKGGNIPQITPLIGEPDSGPISSGGGGATPTVVTSQQINAAAEQLCRQCPKPELQTLLTSIQNLTIVLKKCGKLNAAEHMEKWSSAIITAYAELTGSGNSSCTNLLMDSSLGLTSCVKGSASAATLSTTGSAANNGPGSSLWRLSGRIAAKIWPNSSVPQPADMHSLNATAVTQGTAGGLVTVPISTGNTMTSTSAKSNPLLPMCADSMQPRFLPTASSARLAANQTQLLLKRSRSTTSNQGCKEIALSSESSAVEDRSPVRGTSQDCQMSSLLPYSATSQIPPLHTASTSTSSHPADPATTFNSRLNRMEESFELA